MNFRKQWPNLPFFSEKEQVISFRRFTTGVNRLLSDAWMEGSTDEENNDCVETARQGTW